MVEIGNIRFRCNPVSPVGGYWIARSSRAMTAWVVEGHCSVFDPGEPIRYRLRTAFHGITSREATEDGRSGCFARIRFRRYRAGKRKADRCPRLLGHQ